MMYQTASKLLFPVSKQVATITNFVQTVIGIFISFCGKLYRVVFPKQPYGTAFYGLIYQNISER
jgi:hypothetical protein